MWKKIKRILKNVLLFPVLIAFAKGSYEEGDPPELLETDYTDPAMDFLTELMGKDVTLPTVDIPKLSDMEKKLVTFGSSIIEKMMGAGKPEAYELGLEKIKDMPFIMDVVRINIEDPREALVLMKLAKRTGGDIYEVEHVKKPFIARVKEEVKKVPGFIDKLSKTTEKIAKRIKGETYITEVEEDEFTDLFDVLNKLA